MITIYHLDTSRSERIVWLMEELGLDYELEVFDRRPDIFAPDVLKEIHPLGRAPVIRDGDTVLAESGAIVEYIIARHGGGRLSIAPSEPDFAQYLYWLHYAEGSLLQQLLREWSLERMLPDPDAAPGMARMRATTRLHLSFTGDHLAKHPYFAGPAFTAADIMMVFCFTTLWCFASPRCNASVPSTCHPIRRSPTIWAASRRVPPTARPCSWPGLAARKADALMTRPAASPHGTAPAPGPPY